MLYSFVCGKDISVMASWHDSNLKAATKSYYAVMKNVKTQLILASLTERQLPPYKDLLDKDGWREICWYPGCHGVLKDSPNQLCDKSYKVHLYARINPKAKLVDIPQGSEYYANTAYYPLSCSVQSSDGFPKTGKPTISDYHRAIGIARLGLNDKLSETREHGEWRKFCTTELATYWFWGLKPTETDVFKFGDKDER